MPRRPFTAILAPSRLILAAKRTLYIILIFQISGCSQAAIKARQTIEFKVADKYVAIEESCTNSDPNDLDAEKEAIECERDQVLPMMEKEKYIDRDIYAALYTDELKLVDTYKLKYGVHIKENVRLAFQADLRKLTTMASAIHNNRETQRIEDDKRHAQQVGNAVAAIAIVGAVAGGTYYAAKHGGGGGGGGGSCQITNNVQGCCSYHQGVNACYADRVVCNDGQFSPTCTCTCY